MRLLLDTHVWLWSSLEPQKLGAEVLAELEDPSNELWLSPISVWEVLLLAERGRVLLDGGPEAWVQATLSDTRLQEASFTHEIALATSRLGLAHGDPADRILVATALVGGLTLVTADKRLLALEQIPILPAH